MQDNEEKSPAEEFDEIEHHETMYPEVGYDPLRPRNEDEAKMLTARYEDGEEVDVSPMMVVVALAGRYSLLSNGEMTLRELFSGFSIVFAGIFFLKALEIGVEYVCPRLVEIKSTVARATLFMQEKKSHDTEYKLKGSRIMKFYLLLSRSYTEEAVDELLRDRDLLCPISQDIIFLPVLASSKRWYNKQEIEAWLARGNRTDPVDRSVLTSLKKSVGKQEEILKALVEIKQQLSANTENTQDRGADAPRMV